jgi:hypothetical protein
VPLKLSLKVTRTLFILRARKFIFRSQALQEIITIGSIVGVTSCCCGQEIITIVSIVGVTSCCCGQDTGTESTALNGHLTCGVCTRDAQQTDVGCTKKTDVRCTKKNRCGVHKKKQMWGAQKKQMWGVQAPLSKQRNVSGQVRALFSNDIPPSMISHIHS